MMMVMIVMVFVTVFTVLMILAALTLLIVVIMVVMVSVFMIMMMLIFIVPAVVMVMFMLMLMLVIIPSRTFFSPAVSVRLMTMRSALTTWSLKLIPVQKLELRCLSNMATEQLMETLRKELSMPASPF